MADALNVFGVVETAEATAAPDGTRFVVHERVAALVAGTGSEPVHAARALRTHWRVLEECSATATVLPVRFGTAVAGERALVDDFLAPSQDDLTARLAEMRGKVQLTVKGFYDEESLMRSVVSGSPAIARLNAEVGSLPDDAAYYKRIELGRMVAAEVEQARARDAALVLERLAPLALAARQETPGTMDGAVNAAFLVERPRMDAFSAAVNALGDELGARIRLRYVGPLPPFSFTGENATPQAA